MSTLHNELLNKLLNEKAPSIPLANFNCDNELLSLIPSQADSWEENVVNEGETRTFHFKRGELVFTLQVKKFPEFDSVEWLVSIKNEGDSPSAIVSNTKAASIVFSIPDDDEVVLKSIKGDTCNGDTFMPITKEITQGCQFRVEPSKGKSSHVSFPYFDLCNEDGGLICAVGWSGQWYYNIERQENALTFEAGLDDTNFFLHPGESVRLPRIVIMSYEGDNGVAHNKYRRLILKHYSPKVGTKDGMPITLSGFDRYHLLENGWSSVVGQRQQIEYGTRCGIDTYWFDAGWFTGGFPDGVGNYSYKYGFPNGLREVTDYAKINGLRRLVWFEPERIAIGTEVEKTHPEWILKQPDPSLGFSENGEKGNLFDMSDPEAAQWLTDLVCKYIEEMGLDIYRHDFNIFPLKMWRNKDAEDRRGITEIKYIENLYKFWDTIIERFPGILVDNCASGGNRIDIESSLRTVYLWRSDTGCFPESDEHPTITWNQNQSISLSKYIPYHTTASWVLKAYNCRSAMTNGFVGNFDSLVDDFDFETAAKIYAESKHFRSYWLCDFEPLTEATHDNTIWTGYHFYKEDSGMLMIFRRDKSTEREKKIKISNAMRSRDYKLIIIDEEFRKQDICVSGDDLSDGFTFTIENARASLAVEYILID